MGTYVNGKEVKERLLEKQLDEMKKSNKLIKNSKKITLKDYITYTLAAISIIIAQLWMSLV